MFQVFLIIFWATIRLQSRGGAVYDPSVGASDSSPQVEPMVVTCGAVLFASPAKGRWGRRKAHGSVGSRFFQQLRQRPLSRRSRQLPLAGEPKAMTYLRHVSGAKRTSMGKISRRPRNMSKHRTALLIILSPETPMVKVFESMP